MSDKYFEEEDDGYGYQENESETITADQLALYLSTKPLLEAMALEFRKLASKKPETTLSKTKVTFVNRLLTDLQRLLEAQPTIKYLDLLADEELPQYSDVVLTLSQYEAAMNTFKGRYYRFSRSTSSSKWSIRGDLEAEELEEDEDESNDKN